MATPPSSYLRLFLPLVNTLCNIILPKGYDVEILIINFENLIIKCIITPCGYELVL